VAIAAEFVGAYVRQGDLMAQVMAGATYNEMLAAFAEMAALESMCKACA
jgi:hypothetical protein